MLAEKCKSKPTSGTDRATWYISEITKRSQIALANAGLSFSQSHRTHAFWAGVDRGTYHEIAETNPIAESEEIAKLPPPLSAS
jgi:hypothetical protein